MENDARRIAVITFRLSIIWWALAVLAFIFNVVGLWFPWQYAMVGYILFSIAPIISSLIVIIFSIIEKCFKPVLMTLATLAISAGVFWFTCTVTAAWFW